MLSQILGIIQEFERSHGRRPQLVCLNERHVEELRTEYPGLFDEDTVMRWGFRIMVVTESELPHPKAVWLPPRVPPRQPRVSPRLLAFRSRQAHSIKDEREHNA
jgi:hypothetical protein